MNSPDQNPLVSVILPVYNGAAFIAEAISSALEQTYKPVEIIAVDDGSTDESAARIGEFGSRVQYHFQANRLIYIVDRVYQEKPLHVCILV